MPPSIPLCAALLLPLAACGAPAAPALPAIHVQAGAFDVDGIRLYPGSQVAIHLPGSAAHPSDFGTVTVRFTSPAAPDAVRGWLAAQLRHLNYTIDGDGPALTGTTDRDRAFRIELTPKGAAQTQGTLSIFG